MGYVTSGGFGHFCKKSIALGYVPIELSKDQTLLEIEINGNLFKAHVINKPLYDPSGIKMRK